jgi:hypothetical protein
MANTKPFVVAAFFCENLLEDKDGVLSAIRIVDTYFVTLPTSPPAGAPPDAKPAIQVQGLISLKSGDLIGPFKLGLAMRRPSETKSVQLAPDGTWPIVFNGGEHGVQINLRFPLGVTGFGLYWFDVLWEGKELLTSIPLRIRDAAELSERKPS